MEMNYGSCDSSIFAIIRFKKKIGWSLGHWLQRGGLELVSIVPLSGLCVQICGMPAKIARYQRWLSGTPLSTDRYDRIGVIMDEDNSET